MDAVDLLTTCLCCWKTSSKDLLSFQDFEDKNVETKITISKYFENLTMIEICDSNIDIMKICESCLKSLQDAVLFKNQCIENHGHFLDLIGKF